MKRAIVGLLIVLVLILGLTACDGNIGKTQLDSPNIYLDGKTLYWDAVENANRYFISIETSLGGYSFVQSETYYEMPIESSGIYRVVVVARDNEGKFLDSKSSQMMEYIMGQGTKEDPIRIYSKSELEDIGIGATVISGGVTVPNYYILEKDIDLQGEEWLPIGAGDNRFQGHFDGQGYTISNFKITKHNNIGIFGLFSGVNNGSIKNLTVKDYNISLSVNGSYRIGGLAGHVTNSHIENCHVEGVINYRAPSWNNSSKPNTSSQYIGQLIGYLQTNTNDKNLISGVRGCSANGNLQLEAYTIYGGGLVGYNINAVIEQSFSQGDIFVKGNTGYIGGLTGGNHSSKSRITNCYSRTTIETKIDRTSDVGSLIGYLYNHSTLEYSYATGHITAAKSPTYQIGFVGHASGTLYTKSSYFDYESIGFPKANGSSPNDYFLNLFSRTTQQMKSKDNYIDFDFDTIWDINANSNDGYPTLRVYKPQVQEEDNE